MFIWTAITGFFSSYLRIIVIGAVAALGAALLVLWLMLSASQTEADKLRLDKERLEAAVAAQNQVIISKDDAIAELQSVSTLLTAQAADLQAALQEIANAPASDDGDISAILDRALRRVDGVRGASPPR